MESLAEVKAAYMEADGSISIIADASQTVPRLSNKHNLGNLPLA